MNSDRSTPRVRIRLGSRLWFWRVLSVFFLLMFVAIGVKSHYFERVLCKFGLIEDNMVGGDYWAKVGWTNTLEKLNINADIVFFGNSITKGASFHENFSDRLIVNLGYPGDGMKGMLTRIQQVRCVRPNKIFMLAGINDINRMDESEFRSNYEALVDSLLTIVPADGLYIESLLPVNNKFHIDNGLIVERNRLIRSIADAKGCRFLNVHALYWEDGELPDGLTRDGIHLRPEAYGRWAEMLKPYIYGD